MSMKQALALRELTINAGGPGSGRKPGGGGFTSTQFDVRKAGTGPQAYKDAHAHVMDQLSRISELMKSQRPNGSEGWGHAGTMSDISGKLADLHNRLAGTGEYA